MLPRRRRGGPLRTIVMTLVASFLLSAVPVRGQISPGPLSRAHADLEGVRNCLACHGIKEKGVDAQCLSCHGEIAALREAGRGFHARDAAGACAECHVEHGGVDFPLVEWAGDDAFDHGKTGWALDGKHASLECAKCHRVELRRSAALAKRKGRVADDSWLGLETQCLSCHADPHKDRFGANCTECHTPADWKQVVQGAFDHEKTRYPLRGKHRALECTTCHKDGYDALPAFAKCADCHADPHRGEAALAGAPADCESCHRVEGFVPSTFDVTRHAKAKYALEGKHRAVACRDCHASKDAAVPFRFRPAFARCADCHADAHAGQVARRADGGRCESCHDVTAFRPARFTVADHAALRFPLQGAHEKAACEACHGPRRAQLPPLPDAKRIGTAGVLLRFQTMQCVDCHADPHRAALGATDDKCLSCHDPAAFAPSRVDPAAHAAYEFPLEGAHAAVPCFLCHKGLETKHPESTLLGTAKAWPDLSFQEKARACRDCHEDPHGGQFAKRKGGDECSVCHGADTFRPAARFDHETTKFPLAGAHAKVACAACHAEGTLPDGKRGAVWVGAPTACEACHVAGTPQSTGSPG